MSALLPDVDAVVRWAAGSLASGSLHGAVVIVLVWAATRCIPRMPPAWQAALWWLAALKLILALLPLPAVPLPVLPAGVRTAAPAAGSVLGTPVNGALGVPIGMGAAAARDATANPRAGRGDVTRALGVLVALWCVGVGVHVLRLAADLRALRRVLRRSGPAEAEETALVSRLAVRLRLHRAPEVRASSDIAAPQVAGVWRPIVLLPANGHTDLTPDERAMAICHELVHVRRNDLAWGWVPALAERLFFFHPLARLAARQYVTVREAACDAEVVRTLGVSATDYARLLVRVGVAGRLPALAAGTAPASRSSLLRRLKMLKYVGSSDLSRRSGWCTVVVVLVGLLPFQLVAQVPPDRALTAAAARGASEPRAAQQPAQVAPAQAPTPSPKPEPSVPLLPARPLAPADPVDSSGGSPDAQPGAPAVGEQSDDMLRELRRALAEHERTLRRLRDEQADMDTLRPHLDAIHRQVREIARSVADHQRIAQHAGEAEMRLRETHERAARLAAERDRLARQRERAGQAAEASRQIEDRMQLVQQQMEQVHRDRQSLEERTWSLQRIERDARDVRDAPRSPDRAYAIGEVIVLRAGSDGTRPPPSRVLAIAGDRIHVSRSGVLVNGTAVSDLSAEFLEGLPEDAWEQVIPDGHYFVAAEQREPSSVTRFWGLIPAERIAGRR